MTRCNIQARRSTNTILDAQTTIIVACHENNGVKVAARSVIANSLVDERTLVSVHTSGSLFNLLFILFNAVGADVGHSKRGMVIAF
jgi:hypothetical protein